MYEFRFYRRNQFDWLPGNAGYFFTI